MNSEGLPLDVVLGFLKGRNLTPDWVSFLDEALQCGWNPGSLRSKIEQAVGDVYGPYHRDEVLKRFDEYIRRSSSEHLELKASCDTLRVPK